MKKLMIGLLVGGLAVPVIVLAYFALGLAPAATSAPPMPFEKTLARMALHARIESEMPKQPPTATPTDAQLSDGVDVYRHNCAVCHGVPAGKKTAIAAGMYPPVPQLFEHGVDDDEPGETYWKVKNGIRLTGMPGYEKSLTDAQLWDVTYVLARKLDALPAPVQAALRDENPPPVASDTAGAHSPGDPRP